MPEKQISEIPRGLREQYEKGLAAIQRQNLDYALAIFTGVLQSEPAFYACREALRAAQIKKSGAAGGFLKKMFGTASSSPLLAKGQIALRTNPLDALPIAEQILNADANNMAAHKILAEGALASNLPRTAALSLEIVFRNAPDRDVALKLGQALAQAGQNERAEGILSELRRTFPNDPEIAQVLKNVSAKRTLSEGGYESLEGGGGSYRDILHDKDQAVALEQEKREVKSDDVTARLIEEQEARLAREPANVRLLRSLAELCVQARAFDKALEYYGRIMTTGGGADASIEKAILETRLAQFEHRLAALDADAPDYSEQAARLQAERDAYQLEETRRRVEKYPNDLQLRFDLGELFFKTGRITEAIQEFQRAQTNPHKRVAAMIYLARCFSARGMNDLAARTLANAIKEKAVFDDEKKEMIYLLGCALDQMGKPDEAIEQFKILYESDIGFRDVAARVETYYSNR